MILYSYSHALCFGLSAPSLFAAFECVCVVSRNVQSLKRFSGSQQQQQRVLHHQPATTPRRSVLLEKLCDLNVTAKGVLIATDFGVNLKRGRCTALVYYRIVSYQPRLRTDAWIELKITSKNIGECSTATALTQQRRTFPHVWVV